MDGVIIDSEDFSEVNWICEAFTKTLRDFGIPESEENIRALYIKNMRCNAAVFCRRFGIDDPRLMWERREEHYITEKLAALNAGAITLYPDVRILKDLTCKYPMALVSNSPQVVVDRVVTRFSLAGLFRVQIGRGSSLQSLSRAKPAPDMLNEMKAVLKATAGYYVGDEPGDVQAALAAGLLPIRLVRDGGPGDIHSLIELGDYLQRIVLS